MIGSRRVAVTGVGVVASAGIGADAFWEGLLREPAPGAREIVDWDASDLFGPKELRRVDRYTQFAVAAAEQALADAGDIGADPDRSGVLIGTGVGGLHTLEEQIVLRHEKGPKRVSPFLVPMMMSNAAAATCSMRFGWRGPCEATVTACAAGTHALVDAAHWIAAGRCDVVVAGGTEASMTPVSIAGFANMKAMSSRGVSTPFSADRDGFVIAGGAGVLVLEELEHAKARGARIYGEIVGYGATSDGYDMVAPSGEGAERCMRMALATVKTPIDYINPHATSTPAGDPPEINAMRAVFGGADKCPPIAATKSLTGHSLGATGVQEAIYSLLMMNNGFICESANIQELDPVFADMPIVRKRIDNAKLNTVLSNSFGFGGTNATLVFSRLDA